MTAVTTRPRTAIPRTARPGLAVQAAWYVAGAALGFIMPYLFSSVLDLGHDWYLLIYFLAVGAFLGAYVTATRAGVAGQFRRGWKLSLLLGAGAAMFVVLNVLNKDATPRPGGFYLGFEVLWRGLTYGVVDALLLTAFPVLVTYRLLGDQVKGWSKRAGFAALALVLMCGMTATYHLGYAQYREDGVANPEVGNTIISVPALLTTNPAGSVVAHASMHIAAVLHAYETDVFLPPQTTAK
jgi:hypothetical protein